MKTSNTKKSINTWLTNKDFYSEKNLKSDKKLIKDAEIKVLNLFKKAAKKVPAYKDYLKKHSINADKIKSVGDFKKIPPTTKKNYILEYPVDDRCWNGALVNSHMISTSSGTTGKPNYWPRNLEAEIEGAYAHEYLFRNILKISNKKTLFINGFAMGNWIAGTYTMSCVNLLSLKGYPITSMTPGYSGEAILEILRDLPEHFQTVVISGHTPFLKELVEQATTEGIDFRKLDTVLLGTGQGITENWRDYVIELLGSEDYYHRMISLYGSADAALMGFESPLSIYLRRNVHKDPQQIKRVFDDVRLPSFFQYDPRLNYFEEVDNELHITKDSGTPLIRYNIHDTGGVFDFSEAKVLFKDVKIDSGLEKKLRHNIASLPFVYLFGREKFMVKIYGANIYTEHVQQALNHKVLQKYITGRFLLTNEYDKDQNPVLICKVELKPDVKKDADLKKLIKKTFIDKISRLNAEYKDALKNMGDKTKPRIELYKHGHQEYFPKDVVKKTA